MSKEPKKRRKATLNTKLSCGCQIKLCEEHSKELRDEILDKIKEVA